MPTPIPPALSPYICDIQLDSLTLVTSVLDATANWLIVRFIYAALDGASTDQKFAATAGVEHRGQRVIFVSLLRSFDLWKEIMKKVGLDLSSLVSNQRMVFLDGLTTENFHNVAASASTQTTTKTKSPSLGVGKLMTLLDTISGAVNFPTEQSLPLSRPDSILILDGLDFLLATYPDVTALTLCNAIMNLRPLVQRTIVTCSADLPLIHNSSSSATPLEIEHRAFVAMMAHRSRTAIQLRSLDTGAARDISGVLRVSRGGAYEETAETSDGVEEAEWLYQAKGDGNVRVWERGE